MDPAQENPMAKRPLIFFPRGGHEGLAKQRPKDGDFPVGPGSFEPPPPSSFHTVNPHHLPLTASNGAPLVPAQQQPKYGSASVGLGPSGQQSPFISHQPAFAGRQLPSIDEILSRCSRVIIQNYEQFHHALITAAPPSRSAMVARSSSPIQSAKQSFEVMPTVWLKQEPSKSCDVHRDFPLKVRNHTECGQGVRQDRGKTFRNINKERNWNKSATAKRRMREVDLLEVQVWIEPTVGKGTSTINGKQFGTPAPPAAVSASAAAGPTQWLTGESSRDVIIGSTKHRKIIHSTEGPVPARRI